MDKTHDTLASKRNHKKLGDFAKDMARSHQENRQEQMVSDGTG